MRSIPSVVPGKCCTDRYVKRISLVIAGRHVLTDGLRRPG